MTPTMSIIVGQAVGQPNKKTEKMIKNQCLQLFYTYLYPNQKKTGDFLPPANVRPVVFYTIKLSAQTFSSSLVTEMGNRFPGSTSAFEIFAIRVGASSPSGLPPDVANGIIFFREKSYASRKLSIIDGSLYHQTGKPTNTTSTPATDQRYLSASAGSPFRSGIHKNRTQSDCHLTDLPVETFDR